MYKVQAGSLGIPSLLTYNIENISNTSLLSLSIHKPFQDYDLSHLHISCAAHTSHLSDSDMNKVPYSVVAWCWMRQAWALCMQNKSWWIMAHESGHRGDLRTEIDVSCHCWRHEHSSHDGKKYYTKTISEKSQIIKTQQPLTYPENNLFSGFMVRLVYCWVFWKRHFLLLSCLKQSTIT